MSVAIDLEMFNGYRCSGREDDGIDNLKEFVASGMSKSINSNFLNEIYIIVQLYRKMSSYDVNR